MQEQGAPARGTRGAAVTPVGILWRDAHTLAGVHRSAPTFPSAYHCAHGDTFTIAYAADAYPGADAASSRGV